MVTVLGCYEMSLDLSHRNSTYSRQLLEPSWFLLLCSKRQKKNSFSFVFYFSLLSWNFFNPGLSTPDKLLIFCDLFHEPHLRWGLFLILFLIKLQTFRPPTLLKKRLEYRLGEWSQGKIWETSKIFTNIARG